MPDELSPAHNIFGREVRSGIAPLGRNYARTEAVRTNQIVRAGFIADVLNGKHYYEWENTSMKALSGALCLFMFSVIVRFLLL